MEEASYRERDTSLLMITEASYRERDTSLLISHLRVHQSLIQLGDQTEVVAVEHEPD